MPYRCANCDHQQDEFKEECPKCGGYMEEFDPAVNWEGDGADAVEEKEKKEEKEADHPSEDNEKAL